MPCIETGADFALKSPAYTDALHIFRLIVLQKVAVFVNIDMKSGDRR